MALTLSILERFVKRVIVYHHTLSLLLRYLGKLKNLNFRTVHVRETCFKCYFLSSIQQISVRCHENVCKD